MSCNMLLGHLREYCCGVLEIPNISKEVAIGNDRVHVAVGHVVSPRDYRVDFVLVCLAGLDRLKSLPAVGDANGFEQVFDCAGAGICKTICV
jgi:hypothetical protein